mgnify:CR=1 FL=1
MFILFNYIINLTDSNWKKTLYSYSTYIKNQENIFASTCYFRIWNNGEYILTISKDQIICYIKSFDNKTMKRIDDALLVSMRSKREEEQSKI